MRRSDCCDYPVVTQTVKDPEKPDIVREAMIALNESGHSHLSAFMESGEWIIECRECEENWKLVNNRLQVVR
jgi:hypothetical protein